MKRQWFFFRNGGFSGVNAPLLAQLKQNFPDMDVTEVDITEDIVRPHPLLYLRATLEAVVLYGSRIFKHRIPPRDFFPRLPCVLRAIAKWAETHVDPATCAFTFQTQSLFDTRREGVLHFVYTDHTYLANNRYSGKENSALPVPVAWRDMEQNLYREATEVFTTSDFAARSVVEDYDVPATRVHDVQSGINTALPDAIDATRRKGLRILFVAVEWDRKGGPELIEAFRQVEKEFPLAELHIVGCSPPVSHPRVFLHGRVPVEMVTEHYKQADVFCLPSRMDPSAVALAEGAGFFLPVVGTSVGGNAERVVDGVTGFLVPPRDSAALAEALAKLLRDPELRMRMGAAGRLLVQERFTWNAVAKKMAAVIHSHLTLN